MSQRISVFRSILKQFKWSSEQTYFAIFFLMILVVFTLLTRFLEPGIVIIDEFIADRTGSGLEALGEWLEGFDTVQEILGATLWALVGAFVYMIFWIIKRTIAQSSGTYDSIVNYVHPTGYDKNKEMVLVFLRKFEFFMLAGIILLYGSFWSQRFMGPVADEIALNDSFEWSDMAILLDVLLLIAATHVFFVLFRLLAGKHYSQYEEY